MGPVEDPTDTSADGSTGAVASTSWGDRLGGRRGRSRTGRRGERGATMVEYALLVALFAIPTITAVNALQDASRVTIEDTASRISTRSAPGDLGD